MWYNLGAGTTRSYPMHNCYSPAHRAGKQKTPSVTKLDAAPGIRATPLRAPHPRMTQEGAFWKDTFHQESSADPRTKASTGTANGPNPGHINLLAQMSGWWLPRPDKGLWGADKAQRLWCHNQLLISAMGTGRERAACLLSMSLFPLFSFHPRNRLL